MNSIPEPFQKHVLTPHGLVHENCVKLIEDPWELIECEEQHRVSEFRMLRPRGPASWIEAATFTPSVPLGFMQVTFTVPEPPPKPGSLIYLFPAAENFLLSTILQPVLQYGSNLKFGGDHWIVVCWHCTPEGLSRHSNHFKVQPGDTIVTSLKAQRSPAGDACDWTVEMRVQDDPEERCAKLIAPNEKYLFLFVVAGALEAYSLNHSKWSCEDGRLYIPPPDDWRQYPASGSTDFTDIQLFDLNYRPFRADWNRRILTQLDCSFGVDVSDDRKTVTLKYP